MEERKWEDMNADCLVNIFGRVNLKSRVPVLPFVCKPWCQAVRNPLCWEKLIFPPLVPRSTLQTELIKFVVDQSQRIATSLVLPYACYREALLYVSEQLPDLKFLGLPPLVCTKHEDIIPSLIVKWKKLESLFLGRITGNFKEILELIHIHLPNFALLWLKDVELNGETASAIVSQVPNLKSLIMNGARLKKENLLLILQGCKELVHLDVRNCTGFNEDDKDILRLSSGIKTFQCDGSKAEDPWSILDDPVPIAMSTGIINCEMFKVPEGYDYEYLHGHEWYWGW